MLTFWLFIPLSGTSNTWKLFNCFYIIYRREFSYKSRQFWAGNCWLRSHVANPVFYVNLLHLSWKDTFNPNLYKFLWWFLFMNLYNYLSFHHSLKIPPSQDIETITKLVKTSSSLSWCHVHCFLRIRWEKLFLQLRTWRKLQ